MILPAGTSGTILATVVAFLVISLLLISVLLFVKQKLSRGGPVKILINGEGEIEVAYDTKRPGGFSKAITIFSNAKNERKMVKIKGYVEKTTSLEKKKSMLSEDN